MLLVVKMPQKGEIGGSALNSHGNYIVDHGKSWKNHGIVFEFLWEPCKVDYFRLVKDILPPGSVLAAIFDESSGKSW